MFLFLISFYRKIFQNFKNNNKFPSLSRDRNDGKIIKNSKLKINLTSKSNIKVNRKYECKSDEKHIYESEK
jgi:hypothetical protein